MPATDSPAIIVARFLKANHYNDTLEAFIAEAGLPRNAGTVEKGDLTIEKILEEKKVFDLSLGFEKIGVGERDKGWSSPAPCKPTTISTLPSATNILHVSIDRLSISQLLVATTADRRLNLIRPDQDFTVFKTNNQLQDSPILSCVPLSQRSAITITTGMSGQVIVYDHEREQVLDERRDHKKYVVKATVWEGAEATWIATAGWDAKVFLYQWQASDQPPRLGNPRASISLQTNPETIAFVNHPDSDQPMLLVTRRDSTFLHYYALPSTDAPLTSTPPDLLLLGRQNLAPHSNAWVAFSPSSVAVSPTDPHLLAVATSAVPHMKLIIVRLLHPSLHPVEGRAVEPATQASQVRRELAIQDREDATILVHVSTLAPQTPYSTPQVVWRPDGSGVWVNGDDGVVRGIEAKTGKIVASLKGGHEVGSKVRSIWCGNVDVGAERAEEWVVSGGFDRRLIVWRPEGGNV